MTSASVKPTAEPGNCAAVSAAGWGPIDPIARSPRSMAMLLTSVLTPSGSESCSGRSSGMSSELALCEGLTWGCGGSLENGIRVKTNVFLRSAAPERDRADSQYSEQG